MSGDAKLIYDVFKDNEIKEVEVDVFVDVVDIYGQEFYLSYQSGIDVKVAFEISTYDFEETRHLEDDTNKPLYATKIKYEDAYFNIVRYQKIKNEKTLIICS